MAGGIKQALTRSAKRSVTKPADMFQQVSSSRPRCCRPLFRSLGTLLRLAGATPSAFQLVVSVSLKTHRQKEENRHGHPIMRDPGRSGDWRPLYRHAVRRLPLRMHEWIAAGPGRPASDQAALLASWYCQRDCAALDALLIRAGGRALHADRASPPLVRVVAIEFRALLHFTAAAAAAHSAPLPRAAHHACARQQPLATKAAAARHGSLPRV